MIDAHQHFWDLGNSERFNYAWLESPRLAPIRRSCMPEDLLPRMQQAGMQQSVLVQTQHHLEENDWALKLAEQHSFIAGVVGWIDLVSDECEQQLLHFAAHPKFVGVRHLTQDEPDDDFIVRPDVLRGLQILQRHAVPFDLLFYPQHLPHAATLRRRLPDLMLVIDHLAKPDIKAQRMEGWQDQLKIAADCPNIFCKLSGLITEADWHGWKPADLKPYVETALELFGADRCMFGSDWPVCELAGSYRQVHDALVETLGQLSDHEHQAIFEGSAARFYGLGDSR